MVFHRAQLKTQDESETTPTTKYGPDSVEVPVVGGSVLKFTPLTEESESESGEEWEVKSKQTSTPEVSDEDEDSMEDTEDEKKPLDPFHEEWEEFFWILNQSDNEDL